MRTTSAESSFDLVAAAEPAHTVQAVDRRSSLAEERFRDCSETSSDWLWEQDEDLRFCWFFNVNAANDVHVASEGNGKTRWELVDRGVSDEQWAQHKADLAARRPFRDFRFERLGLDGTVHHIAVPAGRSSTSMAISAAIAVAAATSPTRFRQGRSRPRRSSRRRRPIAPSRNSSPT